MSKRVHTLKQLKFSCCEQNLHPNSPHPERKNFTAVAFTGTVSRDRPSLSLRRILSWIITRKSSKRENLRCLCLCIWPPSSFIFPLRRRRRRRRRRRIRSLRRDAFSVDGNSRCVSSRCIPQREREIYIFHTHTTKRKQKMENFSVKLFTRQSFSPSLLCAFKNYIIMNEHFPTGTGRWRTLDNSSRVRRLLKGLNPCLTDEYPSPPINDYIQSTVQVRKLLVKLLHRS